MGWRNQEKAPTRTNLPLFLVCMHRYKGMADAALERNISLQYCLPSATDMLESLALPAVIQARASGDYARPEGNEQPWGNVVTLVTIITRREPFNSTPMGVSSISPAHLHARPTGRTCRRAGKINKAETRKILPLFCVNRAGRRCCWAPRTWHPRRTRCGRPRRSHRPRRTAPTVATKRSRTSHSTPSSRPSPSVHAHHEPFNSNPMGGSSMSPAHLRAYPPRRVACSVYLWHPGRSRRRAHLREHGAYV